jgi:hypothetical protein
MDFMLLNTSASDLDWTASVVPAFLQLDQPSGTIPANSQRSVHATLNGAMAQALPAGDSQGTLTFHDVAGDQADVAIDCNLSISAVGVTINLAPTADFASTGPAAGPFTPAFGVYTLTNTGNNTLSWQATGADPWVTTAPASGQLAHNASVDVTVTINDNATGALTPGLYWSAANFLDASNGATLDTRDVMLNITPGTLSTGWTTFTPSADSRIVYVSNSLGNDSNNGLSPAAPKRTIAAGKSLIRNGYPDWLLLKCGDTWDEAIGTWGISGRSITEPTLISSYGTGDRPFLRTGTADMIVTAWQTNPNYVSIVGLHCTPHLYNGTNANNKGIEWLRHTDGLLVEDCFIERYTTNIVVQGTPETVPTTGSRHTNVRIRRNVLVDSYNCNNGGTGGANTSQAIYAYAVDGLLMEENVMDHNGWVDGISGSIPTWVRHNGYIANGLTGVVLQNNIVAGTDGVMMRSGGIIENNLYLQNYNAILFGVGIEPEPNGVTGTIHNNVVLDGRDYGDGSGAPLPGGLCIDMGNIAASTIDNNIFAHNTTGTGPRPIQMHDTHGAGSYRVVQNTTLSNNIIYDWGGTTVEINTGTGGLNQQPSNVQFIDNIVADSRDTQPLVRHVNSASCAGVTGANNTFNSIATSNAWFSVGGYNQSLTQWKAVLAPPDTTSVAGTYSFPDPNRSIATYQASIGGNASLAAFLTQCRLQSKANWRTEYTADAVNTYIRAGFGR